jgi:predicted dithiol-disulfide oxidoreductase (DUF899 family)
MHFPNESREYRAARDRLLEKEIELRRQMEAVAEARRRLPEGGLLKECYVFDGLGLDGKPASIRFSELFAPDRDTLIAYSMMFPRPADGFMAGMSREETPCPSCTALVDQFDGAAPHLEAAGFNFVVIAKTPLERLLQFAGERGWRHVRFLSAANNSFKRDYFSEYEDGSQNAMLQVFHRTGDGIRHFWSSEMQNVKPDEGQDERAFGTLEPVWNFMDLTPQGRPDWNVGLDDHGPKEAKPALLAA